MIAAPKPGTDPYRVLALVVAHPGELDAESIGQALWRPKIRTSADVLAVHRAIRTDGEAWTARASGLLGRLVGAGLVERMRPPLLSEGVPLPTGGAMGWPEFRDWVGPLVEDIEHEYDGATKRAVATAATTCSQPAGDNREKKRPWVQKNRISTATATAQSAPTADFP